MRWLIVTLIVIVLLLQYRLWFGDGSMLAIWRLRQAISTQQAENQRLLERNQALEAEVQSLKQGLDAIEDRARSEMGMIKQGETFYQIVEDKP